MKYDHWWNDTDRGKPKHSEKHLLQYHSVHHKSHMGWSGFEPGSLWWETGDQPPESWSILRSDINKLIVCMLQNCRIGVLAHWFCKCIKSCRDNVSKIFFCVWDTDTSCTVNYKFNIWVTKLQCWISYFNVCLQAENTGYQNNMSIRLLCGCSRAVLWAMPQE